MQRSTIQAVLFGALATAHLIAAFGFCLLSDDNVGAMAQLIGALFFSILAINSEKLN